MIHVLFFAQTRELMGIDKIELELSHFNTADDVRAHLAKQKDKWALAMDNQKLLVAINQDIVPLNTTIKAGDEIAFFPPVTGG